MYKTGIRTIPVQQKRCDLQVDMRKDEEHLGEEL